MFLYTFISESRTYTILYRYIKTIKMFPYEILFYLLYNFFFSQFCEKSSQRSYFSEIAFSRIFKNSAYLMCIVI